MATDAEKLSQVMEKIEEFYFSDGEESGEAVFNKFAAKYAELFTDSSDAIEQENKLEHTQAYQAYQELFESKIEGK